MGEHETTRRMQRPALLGLLHEILENDFVTAKVEAPPEVGELRESERVTAIIAVPQPQPQIALPAPRHLALKFVAALLLGFVTTFAIVSI